MNDNTEGKVLSDEERRENLRRIVGEEKADDLFGSSFTSSLATGSKSGGSVNKKDTIVNWKVVGIFAFILVVVLGVGVFLTSGGVQEETVAPGKNPLVNNQESGQAGGR